MRGKWLWDGLNRFFTSRSGLESIAFESFFVLFEFSHPSFHAYLSEGLCGSILGTAIESRFGPLICFLSFAKVLLVVSNLRSLYYWTEFGHRDFDLELWSLNAKFTPTQKAFERVEI